MQPRRLILLLVVLVLLLIVAAALGLSGALHGFAGRVLADSFATLARPANLTLLQDGSFGQCRQTGSTVALAGAARCRLSPGEEPALVYRLELSLVQGEQVTVIVELCIDGDGPQCSGGRRVTLGEETLQEEGRLALELPRAGTLLLRGCRGPGLQPACALQALEAE